MEDFFNNLNPNQQNNNDGSDDNNGASQSYANDVNQYTNGYGSGVYGSSNNGVNNEPINPIYQEPESQGNYSQQYYYSVEDAPSKSNNEKKKNKTLFVIIAVIVICVVVAVVGIVATLLSNYVAIDDDSDISVSDYDDSSESDAGATIKDSAQTIQENSDGTLTAAGVAAKCSDSCVGITVYAEQSAYNYFYGYGSNSQNQSEQTVSGEGSGIIMSESNGKTYIMTAAHVISDGTRFVITLNDKETEYEAEMIGYDSQTDIGVLSIDATGLSVAEFGDSETVVVGEDVVAIGCPGGLDFQNSVTKGIVSGLQVPVSSSIGYKNECIQTDTAINPGNSGGALFNMQGQVIGINSSKIASTEYEGMGFAVPSTTAVQTANSLIQNGYVAGRAKLGISYVSLENFNNASSVLSALSQKGFDEANGTMVIQEVDEESDLYGKVQEYDMIVAVEGKTLTSTDVMTSTLSDSKPGDTITLTIARVQNNQIKTFEVNCKLIENKE